MRVQAFILTLLIVAVLGASAVAQTKPDDKDDVIKVATELVEVPIMVTDRAGRPILDLKRSSFVVTEDGKPQQIEEFNATAAPFEVALLLDTSGSARGELDLIKRAAQSFINSLRPGDRVAIIGFKSEAKDGRMAPATEILTGLTDDRLKLSTALQNVKTSNGTPYYDSLLQVAEKIFGDPAKDDVRGRRALVALTDGVDSTSASDFSTARDLLSEAGIITYFIQVDTRDYFEQNLLGDCQIVSRFSAAQIRRYYRTFGGGSNIEKAANFCQLGDFERLAISKRLYQLADQEMTGLAKRSGGKVFPVADIGEARVAFKSVADEIGTKYSLGYYSSNEKRDGTYRKIKVDVKGLPPGAQIRAREGYQAPPN